MPIQESTKLLEYKVQKLEERLSENEKHFIEFKAAIDAERSKYLFWVIGLLASGIAGLITTFYNILTGHPK